MSKFLQEAALNRASRSGEHLEELLIPVSIVRQIVLESSTQHSVLLTTAAIGIHTVKRRALKKSMQMLSAACGVIHTLIATVSQFVL